MTDLEIVELYLAIPEDRRKKIQEEISHIKMQRRKDMIQDLVSLLEEERDLIFHQSRKRGCVDMRMVTAWCLHQKGFSENEIGCALDKDHSTIHSYIDHMRFYVKHGMKNSCTDLLNQINLKLQNNETITRTI